MLEIIFTAYIFLVMLLITLVHIYWLRGGLWPGENYKDLVDKVLGRGESLPNLGAFIFVIIVFILMSVFPVLIYMKVFSTGYEGEILLFFSALFLLRSFYMFIPFIASKTNRVFLELNRKVYAPLCFTLSVSYFYLYSLLEVS